MAKNIATSIINNHSGNATTAPATATRSDHGLTIHGVHNGKRRVIGAVHQFSVNQARSIEPLYEVNVNGYGGLVDQIPGILSTRTITFHRYDLYSKVMEQLFADKTDEFGEWNTLTDQRRPFTLRSIWISPTGVLSNFGSVSNTAAKAQTGANMRAVSSVAGLLAQDKRIYEYTGCWFTNLGRTMNVTGNRIVNVNATIQWKDRRRIQ